MRVLGLGAALLLAGCASPPGPERPGELAQAIADCRARGGVLIPFGTTTGRVETDFACQINGPPSRTGGRDGR